MIHRGYFVMLSVHAIDNWLCKCVCISLVRGHSFSTFAKLSKKLTYTPWYTQSKCVTRGVRDVSFSENIASVINEWSLMKSLKFRLPSRKSFLQNIVHIYFFSTHLPCLFLIFYYFCLPLETILSVGRNFFSIFTCKSGHEGHSLVAHIAFYVRLSTKWPSVHISDISLHESGSNCFFPFWRILLIAFISLLAFAWIGKVLRSISRDLGWTAYGGNSWINNEVLKLHSRKASLNLIAMFSFKYNNKYFEWRCL